MPAKSLTVSPVEEKAKRVIGGSNAPHVPREKVRAQKVGFVSLGCPKNLVDSEVMMGLLARCRRRSCFHARGRC